MCVGNCRSRRDGGTDLAYVGFRVDDDDDVSISIVHVACWLICRGINFRFVRSAKWSARRERFTFTTIYLLDDSMAI